MTIKKLRWAVVSLGVMLGIIGCQSPTILVEKSIVSPKLPEFERVFLYESDEITPFYRKKISVPAGDCEVALDVVAAKADGAGNDQPTGWWHHMEFYRNGKFVAGCYKGPTVQASTKTFSECYAKMPRGCSEIQIGFGRDEQSAGFFKIESVRLVMLRPTAHSLTPANDAEVQDNTPILKWKSAATHAVIDVSKDQAFPQGETMTGTVVGQRNFQVTKPLAKGTWYWRVRTDAGFVGKPQSFKVVVAETDDTTPPTVALDHMHMKRKNDPIIIQMKEEGKWRVAADAGGLSCLVMSEPSGKVSIVPESGWKSGLNEIGLKLYDSIGNVGKQTVYVTYRNERVRTVDWTLENGIIIEDADDRMLPLGVYGVPQNELADAKKAGFNIVQSVDADGASDELTRIWLDAVHANGLKAVLSFDRGTVRNLDLRAIAERVAHLMGHPALVGWYLFEEPDATTQSVAPYKLKASYELIKKLDPYHPVLLSCKNATLMEDYRGAYDVFFTKTFESDPLKFQKKAKATADFLREFKSKGTLVLRNDMLTAETSTTRVLAYLALMNQNGFFMWDWMDEDRLTALMADGGRAGFKNPLADAENATDLKTALGNEFATLLSELTSVKTVFLRDGSIDRFKQGDVYGYVKTTRREIYVVLVCLGDEGKVKYTLSDRGKSKQLTKDEPVSLLVKDKALSVELKKGQVFILEVR